MIDGGLRLMFRQNLRKFHWVSVESGLTEGGIPDSNACINGVEFWIEYKATKSNKIVFQPDQIGWHLRRARAGGRTFIAVRQRHEGGPRLGAPVDRLFLFPGARAKDLLLEGLRAKPLGAWSGGPRGWPWAEIGRELQR